MPYCVQQLRYCMQMLAVNVRSIFFAALIISYHVILSPLKTILPLFQHLYRITENKHKIHTFTRVCYDNVICGCYMYTLQFSVNIRALYSSAVLTLISFARISIQLLISKILISFVHVIGLTNKL